MIHNIGALFIAMLILIVAGCGGETAPSTPAADEPMAEATSAGDAQEVVIQPVGDQLKYATEKFTVKAGTEVTLVMENVATMEVMQHNVVILAIGADANAIGMAAIQAGPDKGYIPDNESVLYFTPLAQAGGRTVVTFTAPEPGEYPYICTFPGHFGVMKGVMKVVA